MKQSGSVKWKSPSNIALVKYWGKYGKQLPRNPSISFTLDAAHTITSVDYIYDPETVGPLLNFTFEGKSKPEFKKKILAFLVDIAGEVPVLKHMQLTIDSWNSFPHSSGIASSASSMSAIAMCLVDIERQINKGSDIDLYKASHLARLGSGSASRSVFPKMSIWGEMEKYKSSNKFAIPYHAKIDPIFQTFHDDILIVSKTEKAVSSRAGHALMENNPYAAARFQQAHDNIENLITAMTAGDLDTFGQIVEQEALTLHALMMASSPPYILLEPATLTLISKIQNFRKEQNVPVYFTLDAGPNIHMLYPHSAVAAVSVLLDEIKSYCVDGLIISDMVGNGPEKMEG